jgi:hypothetical protein
MASAASSPIDLNSGGEAGSLSFFVRERSAHSSIDFCADVRMARERDGRGRAPTKMLLFARIKF